MPTPELTRIAVASDGRLKANFSDESIILLNSAGSAFMYCLPPETEVMPGSRAGEALADTTLSGSSRKGEWSRQLSEFALHRHSSQLALAAHFHIPLLSNFTLHPSTLPNLASRAGLCLGYAISEAWWPKSVQEGEAEGQIQHLEGGRISLTTVDGIARTVLHTHGRRFAVCYPLLVQEGDQDGRYHYVWHSQVFALQSFPTRWEPAVRFLLAVCEARAQGEGTQLQPAAADDLPQPAGITRDVEGTHGHMSAGSQLSPTFLDTSLSQAQDGHRPTPDPPHIHIQSLLVSSLQLSMPIHKSSPEACLQLFAGPTALSADTAGPGSVNGLRTILPQAVDRGLTGVCDAFSEGSWWMEQSLTLLPRDEVIATYQFHPSSGEAEAWVHDDESCVSTLKCGRFISHVRSGDGDAERAACSRESIYATNCVPDYIWSKPGGDRYPLGSIAAHLVKYREQMSWSLASKACEKKEGRGSSRSSRGGQTKSQPASNQVSLETHGFGVVVEEHTLNGVGWMRAFEDGRVRAIFDDRAIVHLNMQHTHCKVILPDGICIVVSVSNPVGVEGYVHELLAFASWAFMSPYERMQEARMKARVQAELQISQRLNQVLSWNAGEQSSRPAHSRSMEAPGGGPGPSYTSHESVGSSGMDCGRHEVCGADPRGNRSASVFAFADGETLPRFSAE
eukprot:gene8262-1531_t